MSKIARDNGEGIKVVKVVKVACQTKREIHRGTFSIDSDSPNTRSNGSASMRIQVVVETVQKEGFALGTSARSRDAREQRAPRNNLFKGARSIRYQSRPSVQ